MTGDNQNTENNMNLKNIGRQSQSNYEQIFF